MEIVKLEIYFLHGLIYLSYDILPVILKGHKSPNEDILEVNTKLLFSEERIDKSTKTINQNMSMNDIIGNMSLIISGTFMGAVNNTRYSSSSTIIWQPTINMVMHYQSNIEKIFFLSG